MSQLQIDGWPLPIEAGRHTLLDAALDAGVPYPHSCGSGECGSCKGEVLCGKIERLPCSEEALSSDEARRGLFLACCARARGDVRVRWLAADTAPPVAHVLAEVVDVVRLSHDVVRLRVRLLEGHALDFLPGQSAMLHVGHLPGRHYAMASLPGADVLGFHVQEHRGGQVSRVIAHRLRSGDILSLTGPHGDGWWRRNEARDRIVLVAGSTGLAPMLSLLATALAEGVPGDKVHVYHGVRTREDLYADDHLVELAAKHGFNYQVALSHEDADDDIRFRAGPVHRILGQDFDVMQHTRVYAAGPAAMVDAVRKLVLDRGLRSDAFHAHAFFPAKPPATKRSWWARLKGTA